MGNGVGRSFLHNVLNLLGNYLALSGETWLSQNEEIKGGHDTAGLGGLELSGEEEALDMGIDVCAGPFTAQNELVLLSLQINDELLGVDEVNEGT